MTQLVQIMDFEIQTLTREIEEHREREENLDERIERLEADQEDDVRQACC